MAVAVNARRPAPHSLLRRPGGKQIACPARCIITIFGGRGAEKPLVARPPLKHQSIYRDARPAGGSGGKREGGILKGGEGKGGRAAREN